MIDSLHPVAVAVAIACVPIAAITLSAGIDYLAHRDRQPHASVPRIEPPGSGHRATAQRGPRKVLSATSPSPTGTPKP